MSTDFLAYHLPYVDRVAARRRSRRPYAVNVRGGRDGRMVRVHRFADAVDAIVFYRANRAPTAPDVPLPTVARDPDRAT